jgi:hypothetical protein
VDRALKRENCTKQFWLAESKYHGWIVEKLQICWIHVGDEFLVLVQIALLLKGMKVKGLLSLGTGKEDGFVCLFIFFSVFFVLLVLWAPNVVLVVGEILTYNKQ